MKVKITIHPQFKALGKWVESLPQMFERGEGELLHKGRNEIRKFEVENLKIVVKSFQKPHFLNRIVYGTFRASKAQRSYDYALRLQQLNFGTPQPVAWVTMENGILLTQSFYASLESECPETYAVLIGGEHPLQERYLKAIAQFTARLHDQGIIHKDYSLGNILLKNTEEKVCVEIIDLNRLRFRPRISLEEGCRNLLDGRLPATKKMKEILISEYALSRGYDPNEALRWIEICDAEQNKE